MNMPQPPRYLGLDVGGTKCAVVVGDGAGSVLHRASWPSQAQRGPRPMIDDLIRHAGDVAGQTGPVAAVGVAIGGPLDAEQGIIHSPPNLPGWDGVPLRQILSDALRLPVHIEHDAAACALAECRWGDHGPVSRLVYLTCGTGFGAGLVFDGKPYYGAGGRSIEIGHMRHRPDGPVAFGKQGSVEAYCAGSSLTRLAAWRFPQRWEAAPPSPEAIAELARHGDADAQAVLDCNARAVGETAALLADALFPDRIVLGSLARYLGDPWLAKVRHAFAAEAHPHAAAQCRVEPATLGERLQDLSALAAAMG